MREMVRGAQLVERSSRWTRGSLSLARADFIYPYLLNSIISSEIIFSGKNFYTKIHHFFSSINRDLVCLIWTQKKYQVFHYLLIFLLAFVLKKKILSIFK